MKKVLQLTETKFFPVIFILLLTVFSILVTPGYESFTGDQTIFIPPLYHELDPALFQNDLEPFKVMHTERTLLIYFLAFFVRLGIPLLWVLFFWTAAMRMVFFFALYYIWLYFTNNKHIALFILLIFIVGFSIPGTGHGTIEPAFSYRTIAVPLSMVFLTLYLYGWRLLALAPLLFAFTIHPITALPFLIFYYLSLTYDAWCAYRTKKSLAPYAVYAILPAGLVLLFLWYTQSGIASNTLLIMDEAWKLLAREKNAPAFFEYWSRNAYLSLFFWTILAGIPLLSLRSLLPDYRKRVFIVALLLVPVIMMAAAAVGELTMLHSIVKINLQRGLLLLVLTAAPLFVLTTLWHADTKPDRILENGFLFTTIAWFLPKEPFVFLLEQMILFLIPLTILFFGSILQNKRRIVVALSIASFMVVYGAAMARAWMYKDLDAIMWFHVFLISGFILAYAYKHRGLTSTILTSCSLTLACILFVVLSLWHMPKFTITPRYVDAAYKDACQWVRQQTKPDDVFIVEPFAFVGEEPSEFRLICLRPIFTTFKDGGIVPYDENRDDAFDWKHRYDLIYAIRDNWDTIETIKREYRVDYLFSEEQLPLQNTYPLLYSNTRFFIYDIR